MTTHTEATWVFGYGSLIYKIDFPYLRRELATIDGWQRRFWQGSHDHRGTPEAPGRVLTLIPAAGATCKGVAYLVNAEVMPHLDYREKNGYRRSSITMHLLEQRQSVDGIVYIGDQTHHAYMGPEDDQVTASVMARSHGPSGSNSDYLFQLAAALRAIGEPDSHVFELEQRLRG